MARVDLNQGSPRAVAASAMWMEVLKRERRLRGWSQGQLARELRQEARALGEAQPPVTGDTIGRWEGGKRKPGPYYTRLLCRVYGRGADELGLMGEGEAPAERTETEDDMNRRQFLMLSGVSFLDLVAMPTLPDLGRFDTALSGASRVDERLLEDLRAIARTYARQWGTVSPQVLLPCVQRHLALLQQLMKTVQPAPIQRQLGSISAETAVLAGWLSRIANNTGDAHGYYALARRLASEAEDGVGRGFALAALSSLHSPVPHGGQGGDPRLARAMLEEAETLAGGDAPPRMQSWLYARQAEEHAAAGDGDSAERDLERAQRAVGQVKDDEDGLLSCVDTAWLAGFRGSCAVLLGRSTEAAAILEETARAELALDTQRSAVMTDLARAYVQQDEIERACALLGDSLKLAAGAGFHEQVQRVRGVRRQLDSRRDTRPVKALDEQLLQIG